MKKKRIALFGGTFDPVHLGHTSVAKEAAVQLHVEKVFFIPAKRSPFKNRQPFVCDEHRLKMLQLATAKEAIFEVSDFELKNPPPSYTIDTVKYFAKELGKDYELFWLIGADAVCELHLWYKIDELLEICNIVTMIRGGCNVPEFKHLEGVLGEERTQKLHKHIIETPRIELSSTTIRENILNGKSIAKLLDPAVEKYIVANDLYCSD